MKAILIDPYTKTVTEVDHNGDYRQIYTFIDAQGFDVVGIDERNAIYVDGEGLYTQNKFFAWQGYHEKLPGKGLILGTDRQGETVATSLTVDEVKAKITWPAVKFEGIVTTQGRGELFGRPAAVISQTAVFSPAEDGDNTDRLLEELFKNG